MAEDAYVNKYLGSNGVKLLWDQINSRNASYISYDKYDKHIRLWASKDSYGNYDDLLDELDASVFIQDSFLKNIEIVEATTDKPININGSQVTSGKYFKFTFNTYSDQGEQEESLIYVSLADIGGTNFETGNGIGINDDEELYVKANSNEFTFGDDQELTINSINATKSKTTENIRILEGPLANNISDEGDLYWPDGWYIKDENGDLTDKKCIPEGLDLQQIIKNLFYVFKHGTVSGQENAWNPKCKNPSLKVHVTGETSTIQNNSLVEIGTNITGTAGVTFTTGLNPTQGSVDNLYRSYTFTEKDMNGETLGSDDPRYGLWEKGTDESGEETWTRVTTGTTTVYTPKSGNATIVMGKQENGVTYTPQLSYLQVTNPNNAVESADKLDENGTSSKNLDIRLENIGYYTFKTKTKGFGVKMTSLINSGNEIVIRPGTNEDIVYMAEGAEKTYKDETKGSLDTNSRITNANPYFMEALPSDEVASSVKSVYGVYTTGNVYNGSAGWNFTSTQISANGSTIVNNISKMTSYSKLDTEKCGLIDSDNNSFDAIKKTDGVYKLNGDGTEQYIGTFDGINNGQVPGWVNCYMVPQIYRLKLQDLDKNLVKSTDTVFLYVNFPNDVFNINGTQDNPVFHDKTYKYILLPNTLKISGVSLWESGSMKWTTESAVYKALEDSVAKFTNDQSYELTNYNKYIITGPSTGGITVQLKIQKNN
jgi:hypothetical protein